MLKKSQKWFIILLSGAVTGIILTVLLVMNGFAPFGLKSLAWQDANIQYLDFYSYLKDVVEGKDSILYSFGKTLGGTNIAVFSYYLSSPFMLLSLLFTKAQMNTFFNITVVLKLVAASMTICYFILKRFEKCVWDGCRLFFTVTLSVAYALSQYSIAQASNIMWLDGVYMLPLILLGVYRVVEGEKNSGWKLSIAIGYSIFVNWYIAGINCLFSGIWFLVEFLLVRQQKHFIATAIKYVIYMVLGVMLSAGIFLPTIKALSNSSRGTLNMDELLGGHFYGKIGSTIQNFTYGATSSNGSVALFCGCLALIGMLCFFLSRSMSRYSKVVIGALTVFSLLCYYYEPLYMVFSLFKVVSSYWYRFSYQSIFVMLFVAAYYFVTVDRKLDYFLPFKCGVGFGIVLLVLDHIHGVWDFEQTSLTAVMIMVIGAFISAVMYFYDCTAKGKKRIGQTVCIGLLASLCIFDYSHNATLLMDIYDVDDVNAYYGYTRDQQKQIDEIKAYDDGTYRMTQTSTRNMSEDGLTANYNEALAFGYWSVSGYTSSPDDNQRNLMQRLGYRKNGENMCIVDTSILGADSLLGVKYVMSSYPINGLKKVSEVDTYNGKAVYENPFSLPMAFVYTKSDDATGTSKKQNPFEYQNSLYRQLAGSETDIYEKLDYTVDSTESGNSFNILVPDGNYAVYGNIPWFGWPEATLSVNESYSTAYACWLSPSVFYVPTKSGDASAVVSIASDRIESIDTENVSFYALNLDTLAAVTDKLKAGEPDSYDISNGRIRMVVDNASKGNELFLSVPYDKGWSVTRNGEKLEITEDMLAAGCLYAIPLEDGVNDIEMTYHVQGLKMGIIISAIAILALVGIGLYKKKVFTRFRRLESDGKRKDIDNSTLL